MSRLRSLRAAEVLAALARDGFQQVRQKGSHIRLRHPDGRIVTVPAHGPHDIGRGLLRKILRDAEITPDEFVELL
jgi:predicted RNA binding protein YcfA (HicA-like mRNA interferase family)